MRAAGGARARSIMAAAITMALAACSSVPLPPASDAGTRPGVDARQPASVGGREPGAQPRNLARVDVIRERRLLGADESVGEVMNDRAEIDRLIRSLETKDAAGATELEPTRRVEHIADDSIWTRIRAGFGLPELNTPLVSSKVRSYLAQPEYLDRMMTRASRYLYHIVEEIERRGMPTEIALLPFVESAMNPTALSNAEAAGLWQFIPSTGRAYDLKQNWWVDNRRDVVESTRAALDYLQALHKLHGGDWFLALASYNWGEGSVNRAIRRNRARGLDTDYLSLRLPRETRHYVPKLLALKQILLQAEDVGLKLPEVPNKPYFVVIEKTRPIDLELAAEFAGMSVKDFVALNPAHNRPVISASRNNKVKIPAENLDHFLDAIAAHEKAGRPFVTWRPYTLAKGETIDSVARKHRIDAKELLRVNDLSGRRQIIAGTRLLVPDHRGAKAEHIAQFNAPTVVEIVERPERFYKVRSRDSLGRIAKRFGVRSADLRRWNGLPNDRIHVGQQLLVGQPLRETVRTSDSGRRQVLAATSIKTLVYRPSREHRVTRGETLSGIASHYGVGVDELRQWNGLRRSTIFVGQKLQVAQASTRELVESSGGLASTRVKSGDTLSSIAVRHQVSMNDLRRWNSLSGDRILVGQTLNLQAPAATQAHEPSRKEAIRTAARPATKTTPKPAAPAMVAKVKVQRGDTLTAIARRYQVTVADLRRWNGLRSDTLHVGLALRVSPPSQGKLVSHRVSRGDTLTDIARRYGVSIDYLRRVNGLDSDVIRFGQQLVIHDENAA
ncbi:MAG: LysM peptidoglycan-binding domain-containing protein [Burkholderiaceae bacterium]